MKFIAILCIPVIIFIDSLYRSYILIDNFYTLTLVTGFDENELSYNPFSKNFYWIRPDTALWILKNTDYHYHRCNKLGLIISSCNDPKVEYVGRIVGLVSKDVDQRAFEHIRYLVETGHPIDEYAINGYTALHSAVLSENVEYVELLINLGADVNLLIKSGDQLDGFTPKQLALHLAAKNPKSFEHIRNYLSQ